MSVKTATPLDLLTEKEWASQVADLCRQLGWKRYHTFRSSRSPAGYPDETIVRDRVIWLELKTETGKLSTTQNEWLTALLKARAEVYVVRPRHLQLLAHVLGRRYRIATQLAEETCDALGVTTTDWNVGNPS